MWTPGKAFKRRRKARDVDTSIEALSQTQINANRDGSIDVKTHVYAPPKPYDGKQKGEWLTVAYWGWAWIRLYITQDDRGDERRFYYFFRRGDKHGFQLAEESVERFFNERYQNQLRKGANRVLSRFDSDVKVISLETGKG